MSDSKFLQIDEEGYLISQGLRANDEAYGKAILTNLYESETGTLMALFEGHDIIVEAFDSPLVAKNIERLDDHRWSLIFPYGYTQEMDIIAEHIHLRLDEWDRFHGYTEKGIPFVFSRTAQASFFNLLDDYDDDSITIGEQTKTLPGLFCEKDGISESKFWTDIYNSETPKWELNEPAQALKSVLPQLKLTKSKILILGCGSGEDAAFLAQNGHHVTAVDFSEEAIKNAQRKFADTQGLEFVQADAFSFLQNSTQQYDLVFEHTFYCAISPSRRQELVRLWHKALLPGGHLLAIFFAHPKFFGPPFGGSEWEIRQRLNKVKFKPLYWTRWQHSLPRRLGKELVVFAQKEN